jgi:Family of unknown function (DUF6807)
MTEKIGVFTALVASAGLLLAIGAVGAADEEAVKLVVNEAQRRVDVTIGGEPFTSYIWPATLKKPVLYPIRTAAGHAITRGFPMEPTPGERVDHPHHVGLWFNYGDVNGIDFWNNSDAIEPERRPKMGTIRHRAVNKATSGREHGRLDVQADWLMPDGSVILTEDTTYMFSGTASSRTIDRITRLTAGKTRIDLKDNKEGVLGLRVTRALEHPSDKPEVFTDAQGKPTEVPKLDNSGVTGHYLTSDGKQGDAAWGTRGKWCQLTGTVQGEAVTVAIFDHPDNPGYPTYWHARGYGLFAANPLGQKELSGGRDTLGFAIEPGQTATFRYRVTIVSGTSSAGDTERAWDAWAGGR